MEYKLKAISNNIDHDTIADLMSKPNDKWDSTEISSHHICQRNVPVLFSSISGIHLRKFSRSSTSNYSIAFCDLERWNFRRNHVESIGLTPPSTSSDKSTTIKSQKPPIRIVESKNDDNRGGSSGS
ncbi:hypothetical protein PVAND_010853 [Polypedilum vanderplanki]|uniref:Uncharacterized protein n=1 Tax=Polypedilum vanderplanki TaxID=319348 RepID=A0A9J6CHS0_POLVA|nr:hypothetical protein PVAND_010853 [Polypedilum vanderplanki]